MAHSNQIPLKKALLGSRRGRTVGALGFATLLALDPNPEPCGAAEGVTGQRRSRATLCKMWESALGGVGFSSSMLFERMVYLHPQPFARFRQFETEVLSRHIQTNHKQWVDRFFRGGLLVALEDTQPAGYYLNEGRKEPSLLLFKTSIGENDICLVENYNLVLLIIEPRGFQATKRIARNEVTSMLVNWTNVTAGRESTVLGEFSLPQILRVGDVLANNGGRRIQRIKDWRRDIVAFVTHRGICFMFFKVDPEAVRAEMGLSYDFNWVNKGLFEGDGETLVCPPASNPD